MLLQQRITPNQPWQGTPGIPFNDCIISWNAPRPLKGYHQLSVRIKTSTWSSWMPYAVWGAKIQHTYESTCDASHVKLSLDTISVLKGKATAFEVYLEPKEGAESAPFELYVSTTDTHSPLKEGPLTNVPPLTVQGLSQVVLNYPRSHRICSATSLAAVINYLAGKTIAPSDLAESVYDHHGNIYGNWVLNTAQAYVHLDNRYHCWVQRLPSFESIITSLQQKIPVVVSIKGPLTGGALAYEAGHLMVVCGFDATSKEVICMDPAFPTNDATHVPYQLNDFLVAWGRRHNLAYMFRGK